MPTKHHLHAWEGPDREGGPSVSTFPER